MAHNSIKNLNTEEQPYERCVKYGSESLLDSELLAILLKSGTKNLSAIELARIILTMPDGSISLLALEKKNLNDFMKIKGIGRVKALSLQCIVEIARRIHLESYSCNDVLSNPCDVAARYMEEMRHLSIEQVRIVFLNGANCLISSCILTEGTVNKTLISTRGIFIKALECSAVGIIIIHNHPSGNSRPSADDISVTKKINKACELMDIKLVDHIIIGDRTYCSMREEGILD